MAAQKQMTAQHDEAVTETSDRLQAAKPSSFRIGPKMREAFEEIKRIHKLSSDADVLRIAIGTQLRVSEALEAQDKVYLAKQDGTNVRELVFVSPV